MVYSFLKEVFVLIHHGIITGVVVLVASLFGYADLAAFGMVCLYAGRENAQAEYRVIEHYYGGKRSNMPLLGGFERRAWNTHSVFGFLTPLIVAMFVWLR